MDIAYGVPDRAAKMAELHRSTNDVGNMLASVGQALLGTLVKGYSDNTDDLDQLWMKVQRSLKPRTTSIQNQLSAMSDIPLSQLRAGTGSLQSDLAGIMAIVPDTTGFGFAPAGPTAAWPSGAAIPVPAAQLGSIPILPTQQLLPPASPEIAYVYHGPNGYCGSNLPPNSPIIQGLGLQFIAGPMGWQQAVTQYGNGQSIRGCVGIGGTGSNGQPIASPTVPHLHPGFDNTALAQGIPGSSCASPLYIVSCPPPGTGGQPGSETQPSNGQATNGTGSLLQWSPPATISPPAEGVGCGLSADSKLPAVGSPEWCACLDTIVNWSDTVTATIQQWLDTGNADILKPYLPPLPTFQLFPLAPVIDFSSVLDDALASAGSAVSQLWQFIVTPVLQLGAQVGNLLGLDLLRALIRFLSHVRIGWDLAIWGTLDLTITMPWLERLIDSVQGYVWQIEPPGMGDAIECYLQHTADESVIRCWTAMHSQNLDVYMPVIDARRDKLLTLELIEWGRRHDIPDDQIAQLMQSQGWFRLSEAQARLELYDQLPSIADHLHWLQRNVFDDQYVSDYQLLDGFEERFWTKFGHDLRSRGMRKEYAALHYAAHWIQPAPTQMQEFLYRSDEIETATGRKFTLDDYQRILAEQDYSALSRQWFAATAYRVPALGYIRDMYRADIIDDAQLKLYHQRLGYTPADSDNFVAVDRLHRIRMRTQQYHGWTPAAMAKAFAGNQLTAAAVTDGMQQLGYTAAEAQALMDRATSDLNYQVFMRARSRVMSGAVQQVRQVLSVGLATPDQTTAILTSIGFPADYADTISQLEMTAAQVRITRQGVQRVRHAFDTGEIDTGTARSLLGLLSIVPGAIDSYIAVWLVERTPPRKQRSADKVTTDVAHGSMSIDEALVRLGNLGYDDADSRLYLADAQAKLAKLESQASAARDKAIKKSRDELAKLARQSQAQSKAIVATLKEEEKPTDLQKWAALGLIDYHYFASRLQLYGWNQESIDLHWSAACAKKGSSCVATPAEQATIGADVSQATSTPGDTTGTTS